MKNFLNFSYSPHAYIGTKREKKIRPNIGLLSQYWITTPNEFRSNILYFVGYFWQKKSVIAFCFIAMGFLVTRTSTTATSKVAEGSGTISSVPLSLLPVSSISLVSFGLPKYGTDSSYPFDDSTRHE